MTKDKQPLSQEAVRDEALEEAARVADALTSKWHTDYKIGHGPHRASAHREGMSDGAEEVAREIRSLKREPNAAARSDLVQVTRAFLESLRCPNPNCADGWITNAGPDPQHDSCPWCEARDRFLAGDLPLVPGASDD